MKYTFLILLTATLLWSCDDSNSSEVQSPVAENEQPVAEQPTREVETEEATEEVVEEEEDIYALPPARSQEEVNAFMQRQKEAFENELAYFETDRVKEWVSAMVDSVDMSDLDGFPVYGKMEQEKFDQLTTKELIYYVMDHPESWDQVCAEILVVPGQVQGIASHLPYDYSGDSWSERQSKAYTQRGDSIKICLKAYLEQADHVSMGLLRMLGDDHAYTPALIQIYQNQTVKDDLILSCFVEMMGKHQFQPWQDSELRNSFSPRGYLPFSEVNADKIIYYTQEYVKMKTGNG